MYIAVFISFFCNVVIRRLVNYGEVKFFISQISNGNEFPPPQYLGAKRCEVFIHARGQRVMICMNTFLFSCRVCYFRIHKAISGGSGKFLDDLNTSFGSGVLTCDFEGHEFKAFMKWLMKNYFR